MVPLPFVYFNRENRVKRTSSREKNIMIPIPDIATKVQIIKVKVDKFFMKHPVKKDVSVDM